MIGTEKQGKKERAGRLPPFRLGEEDGRDW